MLPNSVNSATGQGDELAVGIIVASPAMRRICDEAMQAARSEAKILLTGESGVGKEVVAHLIHDGSARKGGPFVAMNCAGVPDSLLESELFGHVRGSFTGAYRDKPGLLEQANGGTIFMDEVGEMSMRMQAILLRFLEDGEVHRVGADRRSTRVSVRVLAATNHVLANCVAAKTFREDLYFRLNVIHIEIPPLRERPEDIEPLLHHFIRAFSRKYLVDPPTIEREALRSLLDYAWPGNVRELKNVVERVIVRVRNGVIGRDDLPLSMAAPAAGVTINAAPVSLTVRVPAVPGASRSTTADLFERMAIGRESFWTVVQEPFMARDLTRDEVRAIVSAGLQRTDGSYSTLPGLFNVRPAEHKRFLHFLRRHRCRVPVPPPGGAAARPGSVAASRDS